MKNSLLAAAAVIVIGGVGSYVYNASAAEQAVAPASPVAAAVSGDTAQNPVTLAADDATDPVSDGLPSAGDGLPPAGGPDGQGGPGGPGGPGAWMHHPGLGGPGGPGGFGGPAGPGRFAGLRPHGWHEDVFGLFAPVKDKNLTAADVRIIAEALLLEHGNHDWKVGDVTSGADKSLDFAFTTAHGDTVAKFAVDPASGHIRRVD